MTVLWYGVFGLAINYSAYEAENYRAGLLAIPRGQMEAALALVRPETRVDLLLTDVMLPGQFTGPRLAEELGRRRPAPRVLFASGYSREMIDLGAHAGASVRFLSKPYDRRKLAQAVRDALHGEPVPR